VDIKPIRIIRLDDLPAGEAARDLQQRFGDLATHINDRYRALYGGAETGADAIAFLSVVSDFLSVMREIDREYGCDGPLPLADAAEAADHALRCLAELESWLRRLDLAPLRNDLHTIVLGLGFWAMRHECQILGAEPVVDALAGRASACRFAAGDRRSLRHDAGLHRNVAAGAGRGPGALQPAAAVAPSQPQFRHFGNSLRR